ncbi:MAG: hypothetical protein KIT73_00155 [Burkholderiales bacterium]|nr:hypothetical protein [Burkholderiales bacterium]
MLASGIKSRPVYGRLTSNPQARSNIMVADAEGALAVLDMVADAPDGFWARTHILYVPGGSAAQDHGAKLAALAPFSWHESPTVPAMLPRLRALLGAARMGTQLYLAGTEPLIGEGIRVAGEFGVDHAGVRTEHRGSLARRVQCVHCKGITESVTMSIVPCAHCGRHLFVRDHYSRRIGAFQGVMIDAEKPGDRPPAEELYR